MWNAFFLQYERHQSWTIPLRARLHNKLIRLIIQLGTHWEQVQHWKQAEHCYQIGLEIDETCEAFYHRWMGCLLKHRQRSEARRVFEQCIEMLQIKKDALPGPEIRKLAERLSK